MYKFCICFCSVVNRVIRRHVLMSHANSRSGYVGEYLVKNLSLNVPAFDPFISREGRMEGSESSSPLSSPWPSPPKLQKPAFRPPLKTLDLSSCTQESNMGGRVPLQPLQPGHPGVLSKGSVFEVNSKYIHQKTITNSICALLYKFQANTWK